MANCKKCNQELVGRFCSQCGQPEKLSRIDKHYLSHEVQHLLHFEKGFFFTVKELFTRPGHSIREYITDSREKHMKPIPFLIFTSLIYTIVVKIFHIDEIGIDKTILAKSFVGSILHWVESHYGYANIIMGIFVALFVKLLFRKYNYNIYEITVLITFVMGQGMLILSINSLLFGITKFELLEQGVNILAFAYATWAIGQFFNSKSAGAFFKAFLSYALGVIAFTLTAIVLGVCLDLVVKH